MPDQPKIVCVVPTCRPESHAAFVAAWRPLFERHAVTLVTVWDGDTPHLEIDGRRGKMPWGAYGFPTELFCRHTDAVRNIGFAVAAAILKPDFVLTFDDDVRPVRWDQTWDWMRRFPTDDRDKFMVDDGKTFTSPHDPIAAHLDALGKRVPLGWMNTAHADSQYLRGVPYGVRDEAPVMLSHGVWVGTPDFDGACVTGDTEVTVIINGEESAITIDDFPVEKELPTRGNMRIFSAPQGSAVLSYDASTDSVGYQSVSAVTMEDNRDCVEVMTRRGRSAKVTLNQSLAVYDVKTGSLSPASPSDAVGKVVPVLRKPYPTGDKFDFDIGWWYGVMVGDGCIQDRVVTFSNNDDVLRDRFTRKSVSIFGDGKFTVKEYKRGKTKDSYGDSAKVCLNGTDFARSLMSMYAEDGKRGPCGKKIPDDLLNNGSKACLYGVLSGLLDADSSVGWPQNRSRLPQFSAKLFTSSKRLVRDIGVLLGKLGIRFGVTKTPPRNRSAESYVVTLSTPDVQKHAGNLVLQTVDYQHILQELSRGEIVRDQLDIIPVPDDVIGAMKTAGMSAGIIKRARRSGYLSRQAARVLTDSLEGVDSWKAVVNNGDVMWDVVDKVTEVGLHTVYDLVVDTTKVFAVNDGLVVWDTQLRLEESPSGVPKSLPYFVGPMPRGVRWPLCGMSVMVRAEALPYLFYAPMGADSGFPDLHRFADIFMGHRLQREFDKLGWACYSGQSVIHHARASDAKKNFEQEKLGRQWLEEYAIDPLNLHTRYSPRWTYFHEFEQKAERYSVLIRSLLGQ